MVQAFDTPIISNDLSIDRVLSAGLPVALIFLNGAEDGTLDTAENRLAKSNAGILLVVKIQAKENPQTISRFQISHYPAVVTIKNGQVQSKAEGITSLDLEKHIAFLLGKGSRPTASQSSSSAKDTSASSKPGQKDFSTNGDTKPRHANDSTFDQEVMQSALPVVVDFWAPWCGPCRMVEPSVEKLSKEWAGRVKFVKVNVDESPSTARRYGVQGIPTMMVVKNGKIIDRWAGAMPENSLRGRLSTHLMV